MIKRTILTLTCATLLVLLAATSLRAQTTLDAGKNNEAERERLRRVMDPAAHIEEFRREYDAYLAELEAVMDKLTETRLAREALAKGGLNPLDQLAWARQKLPQLKEEELTALRTAFAKSPDWRELPQRMELLIKPAVRDTLSRIDRATNGRLPGGITPDICDNAFTDGAGMTNPRVSNSDIAIAAAATLAANAIADSLPDDFLSVAGKIVAVIARTVVEAVQLTLETLKNISDDCGGAAFETSVETTLGTIDTNTTATKTNVEGIKMKVDTNLNATVSSRATADSITTLTTKVDNVQSGVNTANESLEKVKMNGAALAKSPTRTETTQRNHFFASLCAYLKLESLKLQTGHNHFALKSKLYMAALRSAYDELVKLQPQPLTA